MSSNQGFRHFRVMKQGQPATKGGVTLAFKSPVHIQDLTRDDQVEVAFSFCSSQDVFCRSIGRNIAAGRLRAHSLTIPGDEFLNVIRQEEPEMIVHQLNGLDWEQHKGFADRVSKVYS